MPETEQLAARLNRDCHCINIDEDALRRRLVAHLCESGVDNSFVDPGHYPFAASPVFVSPADVNDMLQFVTAFEHVIHISTVRDRLLAHALDIARHDFGTRGAFVSYDFHLAVDGPKLIEVNTNAGGVLLNLYLAAAQKACCTDVDRLVGGIIDFDTVERQLVGMFREEWRLQKGENELGRIAIIDEDPESQPLHAEFLLFRSMFRRAGIDAVIASPKDLRFHDGGLMAAGLSVDMVYNRLTDFYLQGASLQVLRDAYRAGSTVVTPAPFHYALYADKRNLVVLSDDALLAELGVGEEARRVLKHRLPATRNVIPENAADLWAGRRQLYFKPATGFGSRGTYRGAKLTRRVWEQIQQSDYVAQQLVPPSERRIIVNGEMRDMKVDLRCVTYGGVAQQLSARIYQGQATNLRSGGGGIATVFATPAGMGSEPIFPC